jgi:FMN phosphatase YigB (HAD superfamily)
MVYIGTREYKYGRMSMSHMVADSLEELHEMANAIGINKKWFQDKVNKPHYDVCKQKKLLAIKLGAKMVSEKEIIKILKKYE